MLKKYEVSGAGGTRTVRAYDEQEAREKAMVMRWGNILDKVTPYLPYKGQGLSVREID